MLGTAAMIAALCPPHTAWGYIGPGAGFAFAGSLFVLLTTFILAIGTMLLWPLMALWRRMRFGNPFSKAQTKRVVILGLDGMDPGLLQRFMDKGLMPNFKALAEQGCFHPLQTSLPSMSPVAWSTFSTGQDPSHHGIFDFLTRDPCTYAPVLSSTEIGQAKRVLNIGKYMIPLGQAPMKRLRKGTPFWKRLGQRNIFSTIQRVPITFPPEPFHGHLLSGMCVPDLRGSQGTFSHFSTDEDANLHTGGEQSLLRLQRNTTDTYRGRIVGPNNSIRIDEGRMILPFSLVLKKSGAELLIEGHEPISLLEETYTDWIHLTFKAGLGIKVHGIARFYLNAAQPAASDTASSSQPNISLYMTPIHIDPERPAMPISHPSTYSVYLAKKLGPFATLGLAEDTWALNERIIDEAAFYKQSMAICDEREAMFKDALQKTNKGMVATVFDTTDRISHMFYRYLEPDHPANNDKDTEQWQGTIEKVYAHMDAMLDRLRSELFRQDTTLIIMSDHGFTSFRRGVNLNTWLHQHGYLVLKPGHNISGDWFQHVDWSQTKAFALGLTGLFINRQGREQNGIVEEGDAYRSLVQRLKTELLSLLDPQTKESVIRRIFVAEEYYQGPERFDAPDLIIGYHCGYRHSWECATGQVTDEIFVDNTKSWAGDHCVDPELVPGIFLCNRPIQSDQPHIQDIAPSVMRLFGQTPPPSMLGKSLFEHPSSTTPSSQSTGQEAQ